MEITCCSLSCVLLLQKESFVHQRCPLVLKQHVSMFVKHIDTDSLPIFPSQLSILVYFLPLHILTLIFLAAWVELVPQKLQIGLFLLLHFQADPGVHLVLTCVAKRLQFLVYLRWVDDFVHRERAAARSAPSADDGHFCGSELADPARRYRAAVAPRRRNRRQLLVIHILSRAHILGENHATTKMMSILMNGKMV